MTGRRKLALGALATGLAIFVATRESVLRTIRSSPEQRALEEKVNSSVRILTYPIDPDHPVTLGLLPQDTELKLLSNLEVEERSLVETRGLAPAPAVAGEGGRGAVLPSSPAVGEGGRGAVLPSSPAVGEGGRGNSPGSSPAVGGAAPLSSLAVGKGPQGPEFVYTLVATYLDAAGRIVQQAEYWEKSTKTRLRDPGALVDREEAFFPAGETTPADTRASYLLVKDLVARGAVALRIGMPRPAAGPTRRAFVRCLRAVELSREEAENRWSKLREEDRDKALREVNLYKADLVADAERVALMQRQWQVVAALQENGLEHPTLPVYFTSFFDTYEPPRDELTHAALAGPLRALALNVVGPLNLWIEVARATDSPAELPIGEDTTGPAAPPTLEIAGLGETGVFLARRERLDRAPGGEPRTPIHVPLAAGPATISCRPLNFRAYVRFYVDRENKLEGNEVMKVVSPVGEREKYLEVRPEVPATNYYDAGPAPPPALAPLALATTPSSTADAEVEGEVVHDRARGPGPAEEVAEVRIGARVPIEPGAALRGPRAFAIEADLLAADGRLVERRQLTGLAEASFFDAYRREFDERRLISDPCYFTLRCPPAVRRLRVRAKERVDVAFYSRIRTGDDVTYVPEDYPQTPDIRISEVFAGKLRGRTWFYYRPTNQFELAAVGREVQVQVQRRLFEQRERAREAYEISNFGRVLEPQAPRGRASVLEPAATEGARVLLGRPNARFAIAPSRDEAIVLADSIDPLDSRPLPITVREEPVPPTRAAAAARESLAIVYVDGRPAFESPLAERDAGVLELGAFPPGRRLLRIEVYARDRGEQAYRLDEAPPFRFFVDRPVMDGALPRTGALYFEREAFSLEASPFEVEIAKTGVEPIVLNCFLFAPRADPAFRAAAPAAATHTAAVGAPSPGVRDEIFVDVARVLAGGALAPVETRKLSIRRPTAGASYAEDASGHTTEIGPGERFFIAARAELEPGNYRFSFRRAPPPAGFPAGAGREPLLLRIAALDPTRAVISRGRFARLNLKGPLSLKIELDPAELAPRGAGAVRLLAKVLPQGTGEPRAAPLPRAPTPTAAPLEELVVTKDPKSGAFAATIAVPPGLRTIVIGTLAEPLTARFSIDRTVDAIAGLYPIAIPEDVRDRPWLEILPDASEETMHVIAPGERPLVFPIVASSTALLRVTTAIRLAAPSEIEPVPYAYEVAFLDAAGRPLARAAVTATALWARGAYDRAEPATALSEPDLELLAAPDGAVSLAIAASATAVYVALAREVPSVADAYTPTDYVREPGLRRVDLAHLEQRFIPLDPLLAQSESARARSVLHARARIREVEEPPPTVGFAEPLVPADYAARWKLLEPLAKGAIADPAGWTEATFAQVRANDRVRFVVRDPAMIPSAGIELGSASRPRPPTVSAAAQPWQTADISVYYDLGESGPRGEIAALADGARLAAFVPIEPHGRFTLERVPLGMHEIAFAVTGDATFYVAACPAEPALFRPLRERIVTRIDEGERPIALEIEKRGGRDVVLNGAAYVREAPPGSAIEVTIERVAPARRRGVPFPEDTRAVHRFHLCEGEPLVLLDVDRFALESTRVFPFFAPLKGDLPDGKYQATVRIRGPKEAAVRFIVLRTEAPVVERAKPAALVRER